MPIPQLSQKIHSPHSWRSKETKKIMREIEKRRKKAGRFFDLKKTSQKKSFKPPLAKLLILPFKLMIRFWKPLSVLVLLGIISLTGLFAWYSRGLPSPDQLMNRAVAQSTKIYDRTGEHLLYDIHGGQQRTIILLDQIPKYAIEATIALEDRNFYEHKGVSILGIIRGLIIAPFRGQRVQGGSTLTQQLVKNAILTNERTVARKIKEIILAYQIEKKFAKDQILQMYFNEIPYGSTAYGIESAAQMYFGKTTKDLTMAEAAILASLPQQPSYFSPYGSHANELYQRQYYCLDQMAKLGYISKEQAEQAKNETIKFKPKIDNIEAPHFVFYVKELLSEKYGEKLVEQGGLKIISTLDYDLQKKAEAIIKEQAEINQKDFEASNAALVAIDVKTGQILAMVGSKDFFDDSIDGQVNIVISPRQPGSSFKPIVYAAAFTRGYVPETVVYDLNTVFPTIQKDYAPKNYDLKEHGPVSLRQALAGSLNIPAVKMIYLAGIDNVLNLADRLGYTTLKDRSRFGLSLVLGGGEVKLIEHLNAFAALAREGRFMETASIIKIEEHNGNVLEEYKEPDSKKVLDPVYTRAVTSILSDNNARSYIFGATNYLTLPDRPVAAKTGTTNDYRDAWALGYTPQLAVGVWVGNNNNAEMKRGADGSKIAAPIWNKFFKEAVKGLPVVGFIQPEYHIPNKPMLNGEVNQIKVKIDKMSGLLATEYTPAHLIEEKIYQQTHDILFYVDKNEPLGPMPPHPENDEYFKYWEEPVQKWAKEHGLVNQTPPTEYDNIHRPEDKPSLKITSPQNNETLNGNSFSPQFDYQVKGPAKKVEFYFDTLLIASTNQGPFNQEVSIPITIINGSHLLTIKIYDEVENSAEASVTINLERQAYLTVSWLNPAQPTTLTPVNFPYNLIINIDDLSKIKKVDFYLRPEQNNNSTWLGYIEDFEDNSIGLTWRDYPATGVYKVYPLITDVQNQSIKGPEITISIE